MFKTYIKHQAHRFYKCVVRYTGDDNDIIKGGIIAPGPSLANVQVEHFERLMTSTEGGYVITDVGDGIYSVAMVTEEQGDGSLEPKTG